MERIKVYGADWCAMTRRTLNLLDRLGVQHDYINVDHDSEAAEWVKNQNNGKEKKPTVNIRGRILTTPSNETLEEALRAEQVL